MKTVIQLSCVLLALSLLLCGCGAANAIPVSVEPESSTETFGTAPAAPSAAAAAIPPAPTESEASAELQTQGTVSEDTLPSTPAVFPNLDSSAAAAAAYLLCAEGLSYNPDDPIWFWRSISILSSMACPLEGYVAEDGDGALIDENTALLLAYAFSDHFDGTLVSVTEEDPYVREDSSSGLYRMNTLMLGEFSFELSETLPADNGTYTAEGTITIRDVSHSVGFTFTDYQGPETNLFSLSLCDAVLQD